MKNAIRSLFLVSVVVGLVFVGTACTKSPDKVMKDMIKAMAKVKTYYVSAELNAKGNFSQVSMIDPSAKPAQDVKAVLKGTIDMTAPTQINYSLNTTINYGTGADALNISGDLLMKDGDFFIKLAQVPATKALNLNSLKNSWYKFDLKTLSGPGAAETPKVDAAALKAGEDLRKLVEATKFFDITEDMGTKVIDGKSTYSYKVKLNQNNVAQFMRKASAVMEKRSLTKIEEEEMTKNLSRMSEFTGAVFIGQNDSLLYRVELTGQDKQAEGGPVTYDLKADFRNFNEPVMIEKPAGAKDFDIMQLFGLSLPSALPAIPAGFDPNTFDPKALGDLQGMDQAEIEKQLEALQKQIKK